MKNSFFRIGSLLLVVCLYASCTDNKDWSGGLKESDLVFQTYYPSQGGRGTELSIRGNNFGNDLDQVQVWVNEKNAEVTQVTPTRIYAIVADGSGSGTIKVKVGETEYSYPNSFTFDFIHNVYTYAGNGTNNTIDGSLTNASLQWPIQLAYDKKDDAVFILQDESQHRIRRIKNGQITTLCNPTSMLNNPRSICFSITGDTLFIGNDNANNLSANPVAVGILTREDDFKTIKSYILSSQMPKPHINSVAVNPIDGSLFIYSWLRSAYRYDKTSNTCEEILDKVSFEALINNVSVTEDGGGSHVISGDGNYGCLAFSPDGKTLYWGGRDPYQGILKADYNLTSKKVSNLAKLAGNGSWGIKDGQGTDAHMDQPSQIAVDTDGTLYVTMRFGQAIRKITASGYVTTYAGKGYEAGYVDGEASVARFKQPYGIAISNDGSIYVSDCDNNWRIRVIRHE